jgi:hypothetical protein
MCDLT